MLLPCGMSVLKHDIRHMMVPIQLIRLTGSLGYLTGSYSEATLAVIVINVYSCKKK